MQARTPHLPPYLTLALTARVRACMYIRVPRVQVSSSGKDTGSPVFTGSYEPSEWVLGTELGASARGVHTLN